LYALKRCFIHHVARHDLTGGIVRGCYTELGLPVEEFFSIATATRGLLMIAATSLKFGVELTGSATRLIRPRPFASLHH
jgi:hypothetical protein